MTTAILAEKVAIRITAADEALLPVYASTGAAGCDIRANIKENVVIPKGSYKLISTGLKMEIPAGFEVQIRPRSGLALKHGITVLNSPGTIDSDYRGDVGVILINHGENDFVVEPLMRIAQMVVAEVVQAEFITADALSTSERGAGGFGHTGVQ